MKIINRTFAVALASVLIMSCLGANGQNCSKKKLASNELKGKFDYRGQSLFRPLNTGDSVTLNVVLYSKQNYRLFVVGEQKLGKINYQIYVPSKKFTRVVQSVEEKKVPVYKKDPLGFYLYDKNGQKVKIGEQTIQDTIWSRETTSINDLVFDSRTSDQQFWEATPVKTQSITIKVYIDPAAKKTDGCVGLYVGCEYANSSQFIR